MSVSADVSGRPLSPYNRCTAAAFLGSTASPYSVSVGYATIRPARIIRAASRTTARSGDRVSTRSTMAISGYYLRPSATRAERRPLRSLRSLRALREPVSPSSVVQLRLSVTMQRQALRHRLRRRRLHALPLAEVMDRHRQSAE